jgi:DNA primase
MPPVLPHPVDDREMAQRISDKAIREIAERISILDVVSACVQLQKAGRNYKGLCPFHPDKNPSFVVNPDRNTFHCFGCGAGGDAYGFYMKFHNVPFLDAVRELGRQAGVALEEKSERRDSQQEEAFREAVALNRLVCQFYHETLVNSPGAEAARQYLKKRGIDPQNVPRFLLGYAPASWEALAQFLNRKRESLALAASLGLVAPRKTGQGYYDRFRDRLMFPILGTTGQILGFGGRALKDEGPKYLNSPESSVYHKGSVLYGLHLAQQAIRDQNAAILVEGYLDLLTLHEFGFGFSVAVLGTALTVNQIRVLKRYTRNFILVFDGDEAGKRASFRNLGDFLELGVAARVVYLPESEDPDSFLRKCGAAPLKELLDEAPPLLEVFLGQKTGDLGKSDPVERKVAVLREILPLISKIPDSLERNLRVKSLAERVGIEELFLRAELSKYKEKSGYHPTQETQRQTAKRHWAPEEKLVCQILLQYPSLIPRFAESGVLDSFTDTALKPVLRELVEDYLRGAGLRLSQVLASHPEPEMVELLTSLSCREEYSSQAAATALEDSVRRILHKGFRERMLLLNREIEQAEKNQQKDLQNRLFREKQRLLQEEKVLWRS